jgi:hypothetical protein
MTTVMTTIIKMILMTMMMMMNTMTMTMMMTIMMIMMIFLLKKKVSAGGEGEGEAGTSVSEVADAEQQPPASAKTSAPATGDDAADGMCVHALFLNKRFSLTVVLVPQ